MNYLGLGDTHLKKVTSKLNILLSSYHIYYQNLRGFHWNVTGRNFFEIHRLFEELYDDAKIKIDDIAERVLTLNEKPLSSLSDYLLYTKIKESSGEKSDEEMVTNILENHEILMKNMRKIISIASKIGDEGTVDMIGSYLADMEKKTWILSAWYRESN